MYNMPFFGFPYYKNYYSRAYFPRKNMNYRSSKYGNVEQYKVNSSSFDEEQLNINRKMFNDEKNSTTNNFSSTIHDNSRSCNDNSQAFINIFGMDLYSDDILILCILLSLYLEGVKDEMLFISLLLLLIS